jgi:hypothetical protein
MARKKPKGTELSVFKGREAKLNRAIFETLALHGPQTKSTLQKRVSKHKNLRGTYYASVSKRIHCLETEGYVKGTERESANAESKASAYELRPKAYLAMLFDSFTVEDLLDQVTDESASILLLALLNAMLTNEEHQAPKA